MKSLSVFFCWAQIKNKFVPVTARNLIIHVQKTPITSNDKPWLANNWGNAFRQKCLHFPFYVWEGCNSGWDSRNIYSLPPYKMTCLVFLLSSDSAQKNESLCLPCTVLYCYMWPVLCWCSPTKQALFQIFYLWEQTSWDITGRHLKISYHPRLLLVTCRKWNYIFFCLFCFLPNKRSKLKYLWV